ncbi:aminodeoxychorismate synthase component I [soil metagenome]
MRKIPFGPDEIISAALSAAANENVCILDSCGVRNLGSHLLIVGFDPVETIVFRGDAENTIDAIESKLEQTGLAGIFTLSYELGAKLNSNRPAERHGDREPLAFLALFKTLVVHDYDTGETFISGEYSADLEARIKRSSRLTASDSQAASVTSNFTKREYLAAIELIKEAIRRGDNYQTNLTQQLTVDLGSELTPEVIFSRVRRDHPAPFSAFIKRGDSTVVSASPERFLSIRGNEMSASPIKGTRRRGNFREEDVRLRNELLQSQKDRAENTMIVDLLRNDIGRICEFGSVSVERLCDLEVHPTLFHLVSTIRGTFRKGIGFGEIIRATFPCGSITGAPKIRTMEIIDQIEPDARGLSMGAIGICIPNENFDGIEPGLDMSVAIRTMVIRDHTAVFNVGGGIVIDSDAEMEYAESLLKAKALLSALGIHDPRLS